MWCRTPSRTLLIHRSSKFLHFFLPHLPSSFMLPLEPHSGVHCTASSFSCLFSLPWSFAVSPSCAAELLAASALVAESTYINGHNLLQVFLGNNLFFGVENKAYSRQSGGKMIGIHPSLQSCVRAV